ncbi:S8 family serine peptidase [Lutibacter sp.]|uniref:S8 family serine peptidase n=1 Tax=Lutibacter sp. TaxID=1925666 RepID=UPI002736920D|nr:S8 family serine peptidase [Lutibacter sp.]MDP3312947.1 S8 family serine peptidase [Lutibacter sp.]
MKIVKTIFLTAAVAAILTSCSSLKNMAVPTMETKVSMVAKNKPLTEDQFNHWAHKDLVTDTVPGMSLDKAYKFLEGKKGVTVIVGVIDSGIDIEHEDLKEVLWMNEKEIAGNGIDDDKNGYVDDIYGWNFLGGNGVDAPEQLEITRLYAPLHVRFEGKSKGDVNAEDLGDFEKYLEYLEAFKASSARHFQTMDRLSQLESMFSAVKKFIGKEELTIDDLNNATTEDELLKAQIKELSGLMSRGFDEKAFVEYYETQKKNKNYDLNFDGRAIVGDNPNDITDVKYGNGNVIGSKEIESHGTHVSGIILAKRNNGIGMNGVAHNAKLMSVRAVPDGDERDKDVALAIRYAVDNGAKVINMSFGKSFSPQRHWVFDAIKYAQEKDVLLVHAAGNDAKNIDVSNNWPNDSMDKVTEIADNVLTVGAMSVSNNENITATFTNYGKLNVDVYAPGVQIYSTVPKNEYARYNGTSMASPEVAGVATLVRSYYPQLSASQVKHIIMNSSTKFDMVVLVPGKNTEKAKLTDISISGGVVNAYNALVLADKMVNKK